MFMSKIPQKKRNGLLCSMLLWQKIKNLNVQRAKMDVTLSEYGF